MTAKPFIKWVGGKGQLISQLETLLPGNFRAWDDVTYIEPFVGGGAMLFHLLSHYPNIKKAVINDINPDLTTCYKTVRDEPEQLIASLKEIQKEYDSLENQEAKSDFYYRKRDEFNTKTLSAVENTTLLFFINRTCYNGLYRVNRHGGFNVPFGDYKKPTFCNEEVILADSKLLQNVEILTGDFEETYKWIQGNTLFYLDPPYRPLSNTSSFNSYSKEDFNDAAQIRLKHFCDKLDATGAYFMLSNSDCKAKDEADAFFDVLYSRYFIDRVWASRSINSNPSKRGKLTEIVVRNFKRPSPCLYAAESSQELELSILLSDE
ncbi:MAG: DNA adenine methylase [Akkermansia sp.]|nr:DNA adenine methylase [Akkermansia sp.]